MIRSIALAAAAATGLSTNALALADFPIEFQFLGSFTDVVATDYDAYAAVVTNPTGSTIAAFESIGFAGLLPVGLQNNFGGTSTAPPLVADSFFVGGTLAFPGTNVDAGGILSASSIADLDNVFVPAGGSEAVAFLAVAPGNTPIFLGATAFGTDGSSFGSFTPPSGPFASLNLTGRLTDSDGLEYDRYDLWVYNVPTGINPITSIESIEIGGLLPAGPVNELLGLDGNDEADSFFIGDGLQAPGPNGDGGGSLAAEVLRDADGVLVEAGGSRRIAQLVVPAGTRPVLRNGVAVLGDRRVPFLPEPGSLAIVAIGLGLASVRRR
ncbi:MAG: PEP-CTERM sorting domain-containing protein [Planctomycetota bacterium]